VEPLALAVQVQLEMTALVQVVQVSEQARTDTQAAMVFQAVVVQVESLLAAMVVLE
jgi:hypothetical protein